MFLICVIRVNLLRNLLSCSRKFNHFTGQLEVNSLSGPFAHLRSVDGFGSAVGTVAAGEYLWVRCPHILVYSDAAFFVDGDARKVSKERSHFLLADGFDDLVTLDLAHEAGRVGDTHT